MAGEPATSTRAPRAHAARGASVAILAVLGTIAVGCNDSDPVKPSNGVASVEVVPASANLEVAATLPLQFVGHKADGSVVDGLSPKWSVSDPSKVTVTAAGVVAAVANGSATVTAALGSLKATSVITVLASAGPAVTWDVDLQGLTEVSLLALWAASPTSVFAGGQDGVVMRWTGGAWSLMPTPTRETIVGLWGSSESNVFAVGSGGVILHYDGSTWSAMESGTSNTLLEVWGLDATHVYASGAGGAMLRFDGTSWSPMPNSAGVTEIWGIWGWSPADLVAVGQNGVILRWNGTTWAPIASPVTIALFGTWGAAPNDVYAVGVEGTVLHYDGTSWQRVTSPTRKHLFSVWGAAPNDIYAVGNTGEIIHYDGAAWSRVAVPTTVGLPPRRRARTSGRCGAAAGRSSSPAGPVRLPAEAARSGARSSPRRRCSPRTRSPTDRYSLSASGAWCSDATRRHGHRSRCRPPTTCTA